MSKTQRMALPSVRHTPDHDAYDRCGTSRSVYWDIPPMMASSIRSKLDADFCFVVAKEGSLALSLSVSVKSKTGVSKRHTMVYFLYSNGEVLEHEAKQRGQYEIARYFAKALIFNHLIMAVVEDCIQIYIQVSLAADGKCNASSSCSAFRAMFLAM